MIRATELLLQEPMPKEVAVRSPWASEATSAEGIRKFEFVSHVSPRRSSCADTRYAIVIEWSL